MTERHIEEQWYAAVGLFGLTELLAEPFIPFALRVDDVTLVIFTPAALGITRDLDGEFEIFVNHERAGFKYSFGPESFENLGPCPQIEPLYPGQWLRTI